MAKLLFLAFVLALALFAPAAADTIKKTKYIMFRDKSNLYSPQRVVNDAVANFIDVNTNVTIKFIAISNSLSGQDATANIFYEGELSPGYSDPIRYNHASSLTIGAATFVAFAIFASCV